MYHYSTILLTIVLLSVLALLTQGNDSPNCYNGDCAPCHSEESHCSCCPGCDNLNGLQCHNGLDTTAYRGIAPGVLTVPASEVGLTSDTSSHINITVYGFCRFCNILSFNTTHTGGRVVVVKGNNTEVNLCRENAEGFLCSQCSEGFYHNKRLDCVQCDNLAQDWSLYLGSQLVSITFMFFLLYITNFSLVAGGMNAAIFFAQMVTTTMDLTGNGIIPLANVTDGDSDLAFGLTAVYHFIYGPWNLDFFTPFVNEVCLFHKESYLYYFAVDYLLAFYPLVLVSIVTLIYFLRNHNFCHQCINCLRFIGRCFNTNWKESSQNILASFLILSYTKFGLISINAAVPNKIFDVRGKTLQVVSYFDATVKLYSPDYLGVFVVAVCAFLFLGLLPIFLFLLRYEINGRRQNTKCNWIDVVLEPYQKHFKERCDKEDCKRCNSQNNLLCKISFRLHDYRWIPAIYFVMRLLLLVISALVQDFQRQFIYQQVVCIMGACFILFLQPYKNNWLNKVEVFILLLLAFINTLSIYQYYLTISGFSLSHYAFVIQYILIFVPALWIALHILYNIRKKYCLRQHDNAAPEQEDDIVDNTSQISVNLTSNDEHDELIKSKEAIPNYKANT